MQKDNIYQCAACRSWKPSEDYYDVQKRKEYKSCVMCRNRTKKHYNLKKNKQSGGKLVPKCPYEGYSNISNQLCYNNELRKTKPIVYEEIANESEGEEYLTELDELQDIAVELVEMRRLQSLNKVYEDKKGDFYNNLRELILTKNDRDFFYANEPKYGDKVWIKAENIIWSKAPKLKLNGRRR